MSRRIIYISSMFEETDIATYFYNKKKIPFAAIKYNRLLCEGFALNDMYVKAIAILPITSENSQKRFFKGKKLHRGKVCFNYIPILNFSIIKQLLTVIFVFFKVLFSEKESTVVFDIFASSASIGMFFAAKLRRMKKICVLTDFPQFIRERTPAKNLFERLQKKIIDSSDGYILITEYMKELLNTKNKKVCVIEGVVDLSNNGAAVNKAIRRKTVLYAGVLEKIYGLDVLLSAFSNCAKKDEELHIYGSGSYEEEVISKSKEIDNIFYHPPIKNSMIMQEEKKATLLINPRSSNGVYTRYSFPSKVIEYMNSGTPVLMARLPGIPDEYYRYCYTFDDRIPDGLERALRETLDLSVTELNQKGKEAAEFVYKEKNNKLQCRKAAIAFGLLEDDM